MQNGSHVLARSATYPSFALDLKDFAGGDSGDAVRAPLLQLRDLGADLLLICRRHGAKRWNQSAVVVSARARDAFTMLTAQPYL